MIKSSIPLRLNVTNYSYTMYGITYNGTREHAGDRQGYSNLLIYLMILKADRAKRYSLSGGR